MHQLATTTDSQQSVKNVQEMLTHVIQHLAQGSTTLEEPAARCLLDSTRNVLEGLVKSYKDYERLSR
jgi:hypothetical protein